MTKQKEKRQCIYISTRDKQCNNTEIVPGIWFCNRHLSMIYNLRVKKSQIKGAGMGLYGGKYGFKKGEIIGEYSRYDIKSSQKQCNDRCSNKGHDCYAYFYGTNTEPFYDTEYGAKRSVCYDARYSNSVVVRYANDSRDRRINASFDEFRGRVFMYAMRNISPGQEIFCDYGDDYDWSFLDG
jgi:hypothetical protein